MEEYVGQLWHRLITRAATVGYPNARVTLEEVSKTVGILFRALGGDSGLQVEAASATAYHARRNWLQRLAGSSQPVELAWRDSETLRLPATIDLFPAKSLNRDLYLWLAALAAGEIDLTQPWFVRNQQLTVETLQRFPGLQNRYQRLIDTYLTLRPLPKRFSAVETQQELAIQQALRHPGSVSALPVTQYSPFPVHLWLHPSPPVKTSEKQSLARGQAQTPPSSPPRKRSEAVKDKRRRAGERVEEPDGNKGLLVFRLESLFTLGEFVKVDRCTDEEEDTEAAKRALEDMEKVSLAREGDNTVAATLRFDLDLPSSDSEDQPLPSTGILLPEWDYRHQLLRPDHCHLQLVLATDETPTKLPAHLRRLAQRLRRQFESLIPLRVWHKAQPEGGEIDLDAYLLHLTDSRRGQVSIEQGLYKDFRGGGRDLSCLLLADLSMSTDAWVNNRGRVIDIIRDSLFLFAEALSATGDSFAMYGFCSRYRELVQFHVIKTFSQPYNDVVRGHINAIKPNFYTRMGAAIRYAKQLLSQQTTSQRLLLLLTDGKPNDLDQYEGRYGIEDTRMALHEARQKGLQPFCVTIDERASDYLPHLFGANNYVVIRNPADLPKELPLLYARLTQR